MMKQITMLLLCAAVGLGCGGDKDKKDEGGGGGGDDKAAAGGGGGGGGGGKAIDDARAAELAKLDIPGFKREAETAMAGNANPFYVSEAKNAQDVALQIRVTAGKCMMCQKMDVAKWQANENLKSMLPPVHKNNPELVWEVDGIEAGGVKGVYVYKASYHQSEDGKTRSSVHGVDVHYNNGTNQVMIQVSGKGLFPQNKEELTTKVTKDELMAAAKKALEVFGKAI